MSQRDIEQIFPNLTRSGYHITSEKTSDYNCIAWAAFDTEKWWWPCHFNGYFWPPGVNRSATIQSFVEAFGVLGYEPCAGMELEPEFEKVAIYVGSEGEPTHMARQLESGKWTSKLGELEDIEHNDVAGVEGSSYGVVAVFLRRPRSPQ